MKIRPSPGLFQHSPIPAPAVGVLIFELFGREFGTPSSRWRRIKSIDVDDRVFKAAPRTRQRARPRSQSPTTTLSLGRHQIRRMPGHGASVALVRPRRRRRDEPSTSQSDVWLLRGDPLGLLTPCALSRNRGRHADGEPSSCSAHGAPCGGKAST